MEGISHEACSFAGTQRLGKLIAICDDNGISIDGDVSGWFTEDIAMRFRAYGWHVVPGVDGHHPEAIHVALDDARRCIDRPSLVCCRTLIGWGAPNKQGDASAHGAPLGADEVALTRNRIDWPFAPFEIPDDVRSAWDARPTGAAAERKWRSTFDRYQRAHPELAAELLRRTDEILPSDWTSVVGSLVAESDARAASVATRKSSQQALESSAGSLPELVGGSADLTGSNLTRWSYSQPNQKRTEQQCDAVARGAYVLRDCGAPPDVVVIATGSEVSLAVEGAELAASRGIHVRVVSMPSSDCFDRQDAAYPESVLPSRIRARLAIEAGVSDWWRKNVGLDGLVVGVDRFGESAPAADLFVHFGFTPDAVAEAIASLAGAPSTQGPFFDREESRCH